MIIEPQIIYKDENFIAVDKPAGLLVHQAGNSKHEAQNSKQHTLVDWLIEKFPEIKSVGDPSTNSGQVIYERSGIVHRLDRNTSGVILIARNQKYFEYLKNLFQNHQIKKIYWALVWGMVRPKKGIIEKPISLKSGTTKRTVWEGKMTKEAITEYKVLKYYQRRSDDYNISSANAGKLLYLSLVEVYPKTGRTHQIRIHFASIGHPIVNDELYGPKEKLNGLKRQFLHAKSIEFNQNEKSKIKIETDLPNDLNAVLKNLEKLEA